MVAEVGLIAVAVEAVGSLAAPAPEAAIASIAQAKTIASTSLLILGLNTSVRPKSRRQASRSARLGSKAQMWYMVAPAARDSASATSATVDCASTSRAASAASANTPVAPVPTGPSSSSTNSSTVISAAGRANE